MNPLLPVIITSIIIRVVALFSAMLLQRRLRDWRMGLLALLIALLVARSVLELANFLDRDPGRELTYLEVGVEVFGWAVSIMAFLAVFFLERFVLERGQVLEALGESDERYGALLRSVQDVVWERTADGSQLLYANPALELIYGRTFDEFFSNPNLWFEVIDPEYREDVKRRFEALAENGGYVTEYRIIRPDGQIRWVRDRTNVMRDSAGRITAINGVITDITDRKQQDEAAAGGVEG